MEEVDAIILHSLRDLGCDIAEDARLQLLTPEDIFQFLSKLCQVINTEMTIPSSLPAQMAQRFSAATHLVDACKSLGFMGDLGYQTILYSNTNELRRIFMWLIERLPQKDEDKTDSFQSGTISKIKSIEDEIARKLKEDLSRPWVLEFLQKPPNIKFWPIELQKPDVTKEITDHQREYHQKYQPTIFQQTRNLMASLIHTHDVDLFKTYYTPDDYSTIAQKLRNSTIRSTQSLNLSSPSKSVTTRTNTETIADAEEAPITAIKPKTKFELLTEKVEELKNKIDEQEDVYRQLTMDKNDQIRSIEAETVQLEQLKKDKKLKMQVAMLLDNPEESKQRLEQSLEVAQKRMENLNAKFEAHKQPLEQQLKTCSGKNAAKMQRIEEKNSSIKAMKQKVYEVQEDIKHKTQIHQQLQTELAKLKRVTERSAYTSRIVDIIKSIKKQNNDINEILKDTRALQKAINTLTGQLERQFSATDDLLFKNAKRDEYTKKCYKLLIALHTEFSELIHLIEDTGSIQREIRELDDQIDIERQLNVHQKLEQITRDLQMVEGTESQ